MTRPPKDKAIQRLQKALDAIEDLKQRPEDSSEFQKWHRNTEIAIANTFGENSRHVRDFTSIDYASPIATSSHDRIRLPEVVYLGAGAGYFRFAIND